MMSAFTMMRPLPSGCPLWGLFLLGPALCLPNLSIAEEASAKATGGKYVRVLRNDAGEAIALQTASRRFQGRRGTVVDLIGVVHIGEKAYYQALNEQFTQYDALLYELVAPAGTVVPQGGRGAADNPIAMMHQMAQSVLGLESQLDHIDYTRGNFVHADMSPAEMLQAMKDRGDTPVSFALSAAADMLRQANKRAAEAQKRAKENPQTPEVSFLSLMTDENAGAKLKVQMAEEFGAMGDPDMALGATMNQSIVQDRNQAALRVLRKQLGDGAKRLGIFYGAAHMPDFERRLQKEFGMRPTAVRWHTAWDLTRETKTVTPLQMMLQMLEG